jgi:recombination protein RecT
MVQRPSEKALKPVEKLKLAIASPSIQEQFRNAMAESSPLFVASVIDAYASSKALQECPPAAVIQEALRAAVLRLPIARGLGFAYIVPRAGVPQMQIGWRGWVQLAQRTGKYKYLNVDCVFEGEKVAVDRMTGAIEITGTQASDNPIGFLAYFELLNGFRKAMYWSAEKMSAHRDRYVPKWTNGSAWVTHPREMAQKTVLSALLRKFGVLSVEMQQAMQQEEADQGQPLEMAANSEPIDVAPEPEPAPEASGAAEQPTLDF